MDSNYWWIWMIVAAFFVVGEIFTAGFFLLWFGVGAAVSGVLALLGMGTAIQMIAFIVVSLVLFLVSRPFANRISKPQPPGIGADRFVGKEGVVIEPIDNQENTGRIRLDREEWRAESEADAKIEVGARIVVSGISGNHMIVTEKEGA